MSQRERGRRAPRVSRSRSRRVPYLVVAIIAVGAAAAAALIHWSTSTTPPPPAARAPAAAGVGKVLGRADAPVTIEVFSDFLCSHCGDFARGTEQALITEYVNPGVARIVYRHFPIVAPLSERAAQASECAADQQQFWPYHDAMFTRAAAGRLRSPSDLEAAARDLGMDAEAFTACLRGGDARARVDADRRDGERRGVRGTPTSFVNGVLVAGAQPIDAFRGPIQAALER